jgi:hypothetical protein
MKPTTRSPIPAGLRRLLFATALLALGALIAPAAGSAAITTFGNPLLAPPTLNTAENLGYAGVNTAVLPTPAIPTGNVHTYHYGADTALWNPIGAPATGQALKINLEGCAQSAPGGPAPLTQVHFQDLSPLPNRGAKVNLTSQPFNVPVCGVDGAGPATVSTYEPINLCVSQGDYVGFNDEGGFVEGPYQSGVPFQVIGAAAGSTLDSFIRGDGTNNGATFSPLDTTTMDGFMFNANEALTMQVVFATGPDATHICAGGTAGLPPALPPLTVKPQTDGINHSRIVSVAVFCRISPCQGVATLTLAGSRASVGHSSFSVQGPKTMHVPIRVTPKVVTLIRKHHGISATLTAVVGGTAVSQAISVKIL